MTPGYAPATYDDMAAYVFYSFVHIFSTYSITSSNAGGVDCKPLKAVFIYRYFQANWRSLNAGFKRNTLLIVSAITARWFGKGNTGFCLPQSIFEILIIIVSIFQKTTEVSNVASLTSIAGGSPMINWEVAEYHPLNRVPVLSKWTDRYYWVTIYQVTG